MGVVHPEKKGTTRLEKSSSHLRKGSVIVRGKKRPGEDERGEEPGSSSAKREVGKQFQRGGRMAFLLRKALRGRWRKNNTPYGKNEGDTAGQSKDGKGLPLVGLAPSQKKNKEKSQQNEEEERIWRCVWWEVTEAP